EQSPDSSYLLWAEATSSHEFPDDEAVHRVGDVGSDGATLLYRFIDILFGYEGLSHKLHGLLNLVLDLALDMEIVRQDPGMFESGRIPHGQKGLVEFPDVRGLLLKGIVESLEELSLTKSVLWFFLRAVEGGHDGLLDHLPWEHHLVPNLLGHGLEELSVGIAPVACIDYVGDSGCCLVTGQDREDLDAGASGVERDGIAGGTASLDILPSLDPCVEH